MHLEVGNEHLALLKEQINKQETVVCISDSDPEAVSRSRFQHSGVE